MGILVFASFLPFAFVGYDFHHDGLMLKTAMDLASGQRIFTETFSQYGPLAAWLQGAALWMFGANLSVLKVLNVFLYALSLASFVLAWRRFLSAREAAVAAGIWFGMAYFFDPEWVMLPWPSVFALLFQGLSVVAMMRAVEARDAGRSPAMGLLGAALAGTLLFWSRQNIGIYHLGALAWVSVIVFGWRDRQAALGFGAGIVVGLGGGFLFLAAQGALPEWFEQTLAMPRRWAGSWGNPLSRVPLSLFHKGFGAAFFFALLYAGWEGARRRTWGVIVVPLGVFAIASLEFPRLVEEFPSGSYALIPAVAGVVAVRGLFRPRSDDRIWALSVLSVASWLQYYPVTERRHIFWAITPALGLFVWAYYRIFSRVRGAGILLTLLFSPLALNVVMGLYRQARHPWVIYERVSPLQGRRMEAADARRCDEIQNVVEEQERQWPGIPVMIESIDADFGIFSKNLRNVTGRYVRFNYPLEVQREETRARVTALERGERYLIFLSGEFLKAYERGDPESLGVIARERFGYRFAAHGEFGVLTKP